MENTENTQPQAQPEGPKEGEFQCTHCMKCKPEGEGVQIEGEKFCCTGCHARGPIHAKTPNTCEFC